MDMPKAPHPDRCHQPNVSSQGRALPRSAVLCCAELCVPFWRLAAVSSFGFIPVPTTSEDGPRSTGRSSLESCTGCGCSLASLPEEGLPGRAASRRLPGGFSRREQAVCRGKDRQGELSVRLLLLGTSQSLELFQLHGNAAVSDPWRHAANEVESLQITLTCTPFSLHSAAFPSLQCPSGRGLRRLAATSEAAPTAEQQPSYGLAAAA